MLVLMALNARLGFAELAGASFFVRYMLVFGLFTHTVSAGRTQGIQHLSVTPLAAWGGTESGQPSTLGCTLCSSIPYQHDELYRKSQRFSALSANSDERACMIQWVFLIDDDGNLVQTLARDVPIPKNAREAVNDPLWGKHWRKSIDDEVQNMFDSKVWKVVKLPNDRTVNIVDTKLVFKCKPLSDGRIERFRSRLVARGFTQIEGIGDHSCCGECPSMSAGSTTCIQGATGCYNDSCLNQFGHQKLGNVSCQCK